jgi:hypothetical protein
MVGTPTMLRAPTSMESNVSKSIHPRIRPTAFALVLTRGHRPAVLGVEP